MKIQLPGKLWSLNMYKKVILVLAYKLCALHHNQSYIYYVYICLDYLFGYMLSLPCTSSDITNKIKIIFKIIICLFWSTFDLFSYCKFSVPDRVCDGKIVQIFSVYYTTTDVMTQIFLWCRSPGTKSSPEKYILES